MLNNKISFKVIFILTILLNSFATSKLYADVNLHPSEGYWIADVPKIGKIALSCYRPRNNFDCTLFWIFKEIPVRINTLNNELEIFTDINAKEFISVSLKNKAPYKFLESNIIPSDYLNEFSNITFVEASNKEYTDITDFRRSGNHYEKYHDRGSLLKLPSELPDWIINPAAYLFKNKNNNAIHGLNRVLEHPNISEKTLENIYNFIINEKSAPKLDLNVIARHPKTSLDILSNLFNNPPTENFNHITLLNIVAKNPKSPPKYQTKYIATIKEGNIDIWNMALRDSHTDPNVVDWIARKNLKISGYDSYLHSHPNLSSKTIDYLYEQPTGYRNLFHLLEHKNTSDEIIIKLAKREYGTSFEQEKFLDHISNGKNEEAAQIAIKRLAENKNYSLKGSVAENQKITRQMIEDFISSPSISLRGKLTKNKALTSSDLIILAKDNYAYVAESARSQLKSRYPTKYENISSSLKPLSSLNKAFHIGHELEMATLTNDIDLVKKLIKKYKKIQAPPYHLNVDHVFKGKNKELQRILLVVIPPRKTTEEKLEEVADALPALTLIFGAAVIVLLIIFFDILLVRSKTNKKPYAKWFVVFSLSVYQVGCWSALDGFNGAFGSHTSNPYIPIFICIVIAWFFYRIITTEKLHEN